MKNRIYEIIELAADGDRLELRPINPDFDAIILWREEMNTAAIEGLAVGLCRGI